MCFVFTVCCLIEKMSLSKVPFNGLPVIGKTPFWLFLLIYLLCCVYIYIYMNLSLYIKLNTVFLDEVVPYDKCVVCCRNVAELHR